MTLRARFTLIIVGVVLVTVAAYSFALLASEASHLKSQAESAHWSAAEHLSAVCGEAVLNLNQLTVLNFFKELARSPDFLEAACVDPAGQVWLHTDLSRVHSPGRSGQPAARRTKRIEAAGSQEMWIYSAPAMRGEKVLGAGEVVYDGRLSTRAIHGMLRQTVGRSAAVPLSALAVAILLSWLAARMMTGPIIRLIQGARKVARGNWDARVGADAPGELGELTREFNSMAEKLGELDRLKEVFVRSVSHDLRNPLGAISTSVEMLREEALPERAVPLIDIIDSGVVRLGAMVGNILDTARLREGGLVFNLRAIAVPPLATELERLYRPIATKAGKNYVVQVPADIPPVLADEEKFMRVFLNLLTNAFKFTRVGDRIMLSAAPEGKAVRFEVSDTGVGIAPERLAKLFVPFRSTDGAAGQAREGQGTGLGLSIAKALVEGQGGKLEVRSTPGEGTAFSFSLPAAP